MTQRELAKKLNLSIATVSMALSGSPLISEATTQRVLELAEKYNYRPNLAARTLNCGKSLAVGIITPPVYHSFYGEMVSRLQEHLHTRGYFGIYYPSSGVADFRQALNALLSRRVDGVISAIYTPDIADDLEKEHIPFAYYGDYSGRSDIDGVEVDKIASGRIAAEYLLQLGHRRIGFIGGLKVFASFIACLEEAGAVPLPEHIVSIVPGMGDASRRQGCEIMQQLLAMPNRPTAVFTSNDQLAIGALRAALKAGLEVPQQISILGNDGVTEGNYLPVSLSTMATPMDRVAVELVNLILDKIAHRDDRQHRPTRITVVSDLVVRESTGPAPLQPA